MTFSCHLVCSNCLYVEKRKSGDKLELLLDGESLLDAAHLVMKSMIMSCLTWTNSRIKYNSNPQIRKWLLSRA